MNSKVHIEDLSKLHDISFPKVDRVELIDENGRVYTNYDVRRCALMLQDDNKTLKIMVGN